MAMIATAVVGGIASIAGAAMSARGARKAADAQSRSAEMGIQEQRRQFDAATQLFQPYVQAGVGSLEQQQAMLGLLGPDAQAEAIQAIEVGPMFQGMVRQGEEAILQNAAATGGLRGGNTQTALAQFRPQILQSLIQDQYSKLSGITDVGQASAAKQAGAGQLAATNIGNLYGQQGAAQAGAQLTQGQAYGSAIGSIGNLFGTAMRYRGGMPQTVDQMSQLPVFNESIPDPTNFKF